jgi:hypothetical protein
MAGTSALLTQRHQDAKLQKDYRCSSESAGDGIGSLVLGAPASRRRVNQLITPRLAGGTPALPERTLLAGQNASRCIAANFQGMTFGFEMGNLSANESEQD